MALLTLGIVVHMHPACNYAIELHNAPTELSSAALAPLGRDKQQRLQTSLLSCE